MIKSVSRYGLLFLAVAPSNLGCRWFGTVIFNAKPADSLHEGMLPKEPDRIADTFLKSRSPVSDVLHVVDLVFDVVRVDLPVVDVRHSLKIWNHVDELRVQAPVASRLARNGLRVGVASPDAWPAIRAILDAGDARVRRDQLVPQRGLPLIIRLATLIEPESIFGYDQKGQLSGRTYTRGDKLLKLEYWYHAELGRTTDIRITFEIRHERGVMTWQRRGGSIRQVPAFDQHLFAETESSVTLHGDEFLVIGVSDQVHHDYLLGPRFLMSDEEGKRMETVLLITPKPYQTQTPLTRPS